MGPYKAKEKESQLESHIAKGKMGPYKAKEQKSLLELHIAENARVSQSSLNTYIEVSKYHGDLKKKVSMALLSTVFVVQ
eukprot:scaffold431_cov103-Cylindrotheca_fusiformis.AAC.1